MAAFASRFGDDLAVLESGAPHETWGRFSYLLAPPRWIIETDASGRTWSRQPGGSDQMSCGPMAALRQALSATRSAALVADGSFPGGWVGFLGYELGSGLEGVAPAGPDEVALPAMRWAFHDTVGRFDAITGQWELSALQCAGQPAERRLDVLEAVLRTAREPAEQPAPGSPVDIASARRSFSRDGYEQAVRKALNYIAAGDIYQVNLSQRFDWPMADGDSPFALFSRLRRSHPAWYSALLSWRTATGVQAICSASPELFLAVNGRDVVTRPIKGTRSRGRDEASDKRARGELLDSAKDAAELAMIVDLERNDLGRVCEFGSVKVIDPRRLESHGRVHHTVATVVGGLAPGSDLVDLLAATFPGGSISGAPKVRAMQIIAELEPTARSVYTGAVGCIGVDGSAVLNIAIRTVLVSGGRAWLQVGGGIVADSDPACEYDETLAKARGLVEAVRTA